MIREITADSISPSGTGIHVIASGEVPGDRKRRGNVEMYDDARFFTVTGDRLADSPATIREASRIGEVHDDYLTTDDGDDVALSEFEGGDADAESSATHSDERDRTATSEADEASDEWRGETGANDLSDAEILRKARTARNGERFHRLWTGNASGYDSQSEADLALCNILAFWTGKDPTQMDRLFRRSGLIEDYRARDSARRDDVQWVRRQRPVRRYGSFVFAPARDGVIREGTRIDWL